MIARRVQLVLGLATSSLMLATTVVAGVASAAGGTYYSTTVKFPDGSQLVTRTDTGAQTLVRASDGTLGTAGQVVQDGSVSTSSGGRVVHPMTATPSGFHLFGTNITAYGYIYDSTVLATFLNRTVNGTKTTIAQVNVGFEEYLYGGSSYRWKITSKAVYRYGDPYTFKYEYWCGVSVSGGTDFTCNTNDSSADGYKDDTIVSESVGAETYPLIWRFGTQNTNRAKFPMLALHVTWPGYPVEVVERFRGWDIRNYSGVWQMSPVSGTGF